MKRIALIILAILLVVWCFASCGPTTPKPAQWPESMTWLGRETEHAPYIQTAAIASVFEKETGTKIAMVSEGSPSVRASRLKAMDGFWCLDSVTTQLTWFTAPELYATRSGGPFPIRVIINGDSVPVGFIVRGDSHIQTWQDITPQTRWGKPPIASTQESFYALLAWCGFGPDDLVEIPVSDASGTVSAVLEGRADIGLGATVSPNIVEAEANPNGIRWIDLDPMAYPEQAARFLDVKPNVGLAKAQIGVASGRGVSMMAMWNAFATHADTDTDLVYNMVKWLIENQALYKDLHPNLEALTLEMFREYLNTNYFPIHDGTIRYLKEVGVWTSKDDARQKINVANINAWVEAYDAAIAEADSKGIKVDPENQEWLDLWTERIKDLPRIISPQT